MAILYANLADEFQESLRAIIVSEAASYTTNVFDGIPPDLVKGRGLPYIIIHTPAISEEPLTQTTRQIRIVSTIEIFDKQEGTMREGYDLVRQGLMTNQATTKGNGLNWPEIESSKPTPIRKRNINENIWTIVMTITYYTVLAPA